MSAMLAPLGPTRAQRLRTVNSRGVTPTCCFLVVDNILARLAAGCVERADGVALVSGHDRSPTVQRPPKSPGHTAAMQLPPWAFNADRSHSRLMPRASSDTSLSVRQ